MPEISGTKSIKCTTWNKTQIGYIELTSALPYMNAQNIQEKSVEYVYKLKPKINCRAVKIIIHSDWQNLRSDKKCMKPVAKYLWLIAELIYWEEEWVNILKYLQLKAGINIRRGNS